jgi:hypothetical protein
VQEEGLEQGGLSRIVPARKKVDAGKRNDLKIAEAPEAFYPERLDHWL